MRTVQLFPYGFVNQSLSLNGGLPWWYAKRECDGVVTFAWTLCSYL